MQSLTFAAPPFYGSQMVYQSYAPLAVEVEVSPVTPEISQNLTVFAAKSESELVLRVVNDNNATVHTQIDISGGD
jgi:hypothetical protein